LCASCSLLWTVSWLSERQLHFTEIQLVVSKTKYTFTEGQNADRSVSKSEADAKTCAVEPRLPAVVDFPEREARGVHRYAWSAVEPF
jgi:hypothetical protein